MISIRECEYLAQEDKETFVVKITEYWLFNKWRYKVKESRVYSQKLIQEFTMIKNKKVKPIGFTSNKNSKTKKQHENKSKTDKS